VKPECDIALGLRKRYHEREDTFMPLDGEIEGTVGELGQRRRTEAYRGTKTKLMKSHLRGERKTCNGRVGVRPRRM